MEGTRTFDNPLARAAQNHLPVLYQRWTPILAGVGLGCLLTVLGNKVRSLTLRTRFGQPCEANVPMPVAATRLLHSWVR
jgi:hypothetical protein